MAASNIESDATIRASFSGSENHVPDRSDCRVCLCEHQVGEDQIQETGSDLFLGLLVFMENHSLDFPRNWCLWYAFLGKIDSDKKKSKICPSNNSEGPMVRTLNASCHIVKSLAVSRNKDH
jgi:hypothetical protein